MSENIPQNPMDTENNDAKILQENRAYMMAVYILFLAGFLLPIMPVAGVIMAYMKRDSVTFTLYENHCTFLIRTFWITLIVSILGTPLFFVVYPILGIWLVIRLVVGFIRFLNQQDINAKTWMV